MKAAIKNFASLILFSFVLNAFGTSKIREFGSVRPLEEHKDIFQQKNGQSHVMHSQTTFSEKHLEQAKIFLQKQQQSASDSNFDKRQSATPYNSLNPLGACRVRIPKKEKLMTV